MSKCSYGRHVPAFILLFLAEETCYGATLLTKMQEKLPYGNIDSAAIYRSLKDLEKHNNVESYWDTSEPGPAKKWYRITEKGFNTLAEFKEDIKLRIKNLQYFLTTYETLIIPE